MARVWADTEVRSSTNRETAVNVNWGKTWCYIESKVVGKLLPCGASPRATPCPGRSCCSPYVRVEPFVTVCRCSWPLSDRTVHSRVTSSFGGNSLLTIDVRREAETSGTRNIETTPRIEHDPNTISIVCYSMPFDDPSPMISTRRSRESPNLEKITTAARNSRKLSRSQKNKRIEPWFARTNSFYHKGALHLPFKGTIIST